MRSLSGFLVDQGLPLSITRVERLGFSNLTDAPLRSDRKNGRFSKPFSSLITHNQRFSGNEANTPKQGFRFRLTPPELLREGNQMIKYDRTCPFPWEVLNQCFGKLPSGQYTSIQDRLQLLEVTYYYRVLLMLSKYNFIITCLAYQMGEHHSAYERLLCEIMARNA